MILTKHNQRYIVSDNNIYADAMCKKNTRTVSTTAYVLTRNQLIELLMNVLVLKADYSYQYDDSEEEKIIITEYELYAFLKALKLIENNSLFESLGAYSNQALKSEDFIQKIKAEAEYILSLLESDDEYQRALIMLAAYTYWTLDVKVAFRCLECLSELLVEQCILSALSH